jgi:opacity protein-like surface antigen
MRRTLLTMALLAACAILAAPAAAQTQEAGWFLAGHVGPSWGTLGDKATGTISGGYKKDQYMSFALEFGMIPGADVNKARPVIFEVPASLLEPASLRVNKLHVNGNMFAHWPTGNRIAPYGTVGIGSATGVIREKDGAKLPIPNDLRRETNPAVNLGAGATLPVTRWFGITGDYRHFLVLTKQVQHVNRFMIGVSLSTH